MHLSHQFPRKINYKKYKSARKVTYKSASLLAIYKAHLISQNQEITMTDFAVAVL